MELVSGKTLSELIPKHGMPLGKFFEVAVPLADAVSAAHENGVVHRDLKPDNLMVDDAGRLKILDFGLAKLRQASAEQLSSALPTAPATGDGHIVGTVTYMSPEQAEGKKVDHRSDVFSIGIVLYEMATGKRPFGGETPTAILSSILKDDPPPATEINPSLPPLLARIIRRCLAKELDRRFQTAKDLRNELEELSQDVDSGAAIVGAVPPVRKAPRRGMFVGVGALVVLLGAALIVQNLLTTDSVALRLVNPTQVTSALGVEDHPMASPDGEFLAYQSFESGNWDIWVTQVDEGQSTNRTADYAGADLFESWSPDGRQIAFLSERDGGGVFIMPTLGGIPRKVATLQDSPEAAHGRAPQWLPAGTELAFLDGDDTSMGIGVRVEIVTLETGASRQLVLPGDAMLHRTDLSWSPDGRYLAYVDSVVGWPPATDGRYLYFTWRADVGDIWVMDVAEQ